MFYISSEYTCLQTMKFTLSPCRKHVWPSIDVARYPTLVLCSNVIFLCSTCSGIQRRSYIWVACLDEHFCHCLYYYCLCTVFQWYFSFVSRISSLVYYFITFTIHNFLLYRFSLPNSSPNNIHSPFFLFLTCCSWLLVFSIDFISYIFCKSVLQRFQFPPSAPSVPARGGLSLGSGAALPQKNSDSALAAFSASQSTL